MPRFRRHTGSHTLQYTGKDLGGIEAGYSQNYAWGKLALGAGQSLVLQDGDATPGGALYVRLLELAGGVSLIASITGNGMNLYYDASLPGNAYLGGQTYALSGGGAIAPAPEPTTVLLLGLGLLGTALAARRMGNHASRPGANCARVG